MARIDDASNQTSMQSVDVLGRRSAKIGSANLVVEQNGLTVSMQSVDVLGRRGTDGGGGSGETFDSTSQTFDSADVTFDSVSV